MSVIPFRRNRARVARAHTELYRLVAHVPQTVPAPMEPSFGPWATHAARCSCNVCR